MISNCGKDENGAYSGGMAGDQTGREYCLMGWYSFPWNCVLRHPDSSVRAEIAKLAKAAAQNDNIGYDQSERLSFWRQLSSAGYDPAAIMIACEADCSSSTAAIVKAVGYRLNNAKLKTLSTSLTTYGMRTALINAGFDLLTDSKYTGSEAYLLQGDILLNDSNHVAINVTNGASADTNYGNTSSANTPSNSQTSSGASTYPSGDTNTLPNTTDVKKGDLVSLTENAVWWTKGSIPDWVLAQNWYIVSINGMRAVLGRSEDGKYNVMSPIHAGYLKVVKASSAATGTQNPAKDESGKADEQLSGTYVVQNGDTLWGIAVKWCGKGWKWTEIQKANGLANSNIYPGQTLILPERK